MTATDQHAVAVSRPPDRRRMIAAGIVAAAGAIVGGRAIPAAATAPPTTPPPTTTGESAPPQTPPPTTAPGRPSEADLDLLRPLQSAELTAEELYRAAVAAGADDPVLSTLAENHQAYSDVLAGMLGGSEARDDGLYDERSGDFETDDVAAVATAGYALESALVLTHAEIIGQLEGIDGVTTLASILIVEARHCAVLADLTGEGDDLDALLVNEGSALPTATGV